MNEQAIVRDGHLHLIRSDEDIKILSAQRAVNILKEKSLTEIGISRIRAESGIVLNLRDSRLTLGLMARQGNQWIELDDSHDLNCDYVIRENVLTPLDLEAVQKYLKSLGIDHTGKISAITYARIAGNTESSEVHILDHAKSQLDKHPRLPLVKTDHLRAELYDYQKAGVEWMRFITNNEGGCILGDEMGLGKTLQIIALITQHVSIGKGPSMIVAPASLLENWKREFEKFTDGMRVCIHLGPQRSGDYRTFLQYDVVICSYNTLVSDLSMFTMIQWDVLVLDEAQNIKNKQSIRTKSAKRIERSSSIAVTGTPLENHLADLWSITDFILPGYLGTYSEFEQTYGDDKIGASRLEPIITPVLLRRVVSDVAGDLPERVDIPIVISMNDQEIEEYEKIRNQIRSEYEGRATSGVMIQKLRMYCTHPCIAGYGNDDTECEKLNILMDLLRKITEIGEKTLIFTSFNKMFNIISNEIAKEHNIPTFIINGSIPVSQRQPIIDSFSNVDGSAVLILNPRAAGVGLNITAASRVIHYNLEWNPAVEDQASARAYRRGQKRTVFVYRLYYNNSVEDVINDRIERKRDLFNNAIKGLNQSDLERADLIRALEISPRD